MIPKLRAWDTERKRMHDVLIIRFEDEQYTRVVFKEEHQNSSADGYENDWQYARKTHLMEWTGAKDMNGTDIYEGDIIRKEICSPDDMAFGCYGDIGVVKYDSSVIGFIIDSVDTGDDGFYDSRGMNFSFDRIEIVGNIYESPDFLE